MSAFDVPTIPAAALAAHATPADCWVAIQGVVYDVTPLLAEHPGGAVLSAACGTDATAHFETRPMGSGTPHSAAARVVLGRHAVGLLEGEAAKAPRPGAEQRGRARVVGTLPSTHITPGRAVDLEVGHTIGAATNVWVGITHGVKGWFDVSFGHATLTGESDFAIKGRLARGPVSGALAVGGGYRFQGVPDGDGPGVYTELALAAEPTKWLQIGLVPGLAVLPASSDPIHAEAGVTIAVRPIPLLSIYGEAREDLFALGVPGWAAGVRFHTIAHTFTLGASSSPNLAPLERIAAPEGDFSVQLALTRQFGPRVRAKK
jgi:hypothetical protein